jgi:hypothetical protein
MLRFCVRAEVFHRFDFGSVAIWEIYSFVYVPHSALGTWRPACTENAQPPGGVTPVSFKGSGQRGEAPLFAPSLNKALNLPRGICNACGLTRYSDNMKDCNGPRYR